VKDKIFVEYYNSKDIALAYEEAQQNENYNKSPEFGFNKSTSQ
jgi:hypothetical protein